MCTEEKVWLLIGPTFTRDVHLNGCEAIFPESGIRKDVETVTKPEQSTVQCVKKKKHYSFNASTTVSLNASLKTLARLKWHSLCAERTPQRNVAKSLSFCRWCKDYLLQKQRNFQERIQTMVIKTMASVQLNSRTEQHIGALSCLDGLAIDFMLCLWITSRACQYV